MIYYIELLNQEFLEKLFIVFPLTFKMFLKRFDIVEQHEEMSLTNKKLIYEEIKSSTNKKNINNDYFIMKYKM